MSNENKSTGDRSKSTIPVAKAPVQHKDDKQKDGDKQKAGDKQKEGEKSKDRPSEKKPFFKR